MSDVFAMPYLQATIAEVFLFLKLIFCKSRCNQKFAVFKSKGYYVISTSSTSSLLPLMLKHKNYQMQKADMKQFYFQGSAVVLCWTSVSSPRDNLCHLCWEVEELFAYLSYLLFLYYLLFIIYLPHVTTSATSVGRWRSYSYLSCLTYICLTRMGQSF